MLCAGEKCYFLVQSFTKGTHESQAGMRLMDTFCRIKFILNPKVKETLR